MLEGKMRVSGNHNILNCDKNFLPKNLELNMTAVPNFTEHLKQIQDFNRAQQDSIKGTPCMLCTTNKISPL